MKTSIGNQTFIFADLQEGKHTITVKNRSILVENIIFEIQVRQGDTYYIKIKHGYMVAEGFEKVSKEKALGEISNLHHNYKIPLPFNKQPKGSIPAT